MAAPSPQPAPPTREPAVQRRRIERVQAILDAAEALLGDEGYEAATLKAIGDRAGIPTASVYHYFGDRHQVEAEVLQRHLREVQARVTAALEDPAPRTLREAVDTAIDPLLAYFREHRSFLELWYAGRHNALLGQMAHKYDETQAQQLRRLLIERGLLRPDTPELALELAYETGDRLFDVAFRRSPGGEDATIDEARRLITAYLETYAPKRRR